MKLESKYNLGDEVYGVESYAIPQIDDCGFCGGLGKITGEDDSTRRCPVCYGKGRLPAPTRYRCTAATRTIGEVRISAWADRTEEKYMCEETGVGTGTVWDVAQLYPTREEAQAIADEQNEKAEREET